MKLREIREESIKKQMFEDLLSMVKQIANGDKVIAVSNKEMLEKLKIKYNEGDSFFGDTYSFELNDKTLKKIENAIKNI